MIAAAVAAAVQILSKPFRAVLLKTLALTILILALAGIGTDKLLFSVAPLPTASWLQVLVHAVAGLGIVAVLYLLVAPVSFAVACFFFDELAEHVETELAGASGRGRAMPIGSAMWVGLRFGLLSLAVNACALLLLVVPGLNVIAFFGANAYLLGRGFFELAALRYWPLDVVHEVRRRHAVRITLAGCLCAGVAIIPLVNLLTPLFATALLVRIAHSLRRERTIQLVV